MQDAVLEQRHEDDWPSFIDTFLNYGFGDADLIAIDRDESEQHWKRGTDEPFWFVR